MMSEAEEEYDEMLLKAQPLLDAVRISAAAERATADAPPSLSGR
jgi:anthranilate/para-aminobenzoate synthase component I